MLSQSRPLLRFKESQISPERKTPTNLNLFLKQDKSVSPGSGFSSTTFLLLTKNTKQPEYSSVSDMLEITLNMRGYCVELQCLCRTGSEDSKQIKPVRQLSTSSNPRALFYLDLDKHQFNPNKILLISCSTSLLDCEVST